MYRRILCLLSCLVMLFTCACAPKEEGENIILDHPPASHQLATAKYPTQVPYPQEGTPNYAADRKVWWQQQTEKQKLITKEDLPEDFLRRSVSEILGSGEGNIAYSPINVYMALSLLAETASGESRAQILDLLGVEDIEALRQQSSRLWQANYRDDGAAATLLANALFLGTGYNYEKQTLKNAAEYHRADIFMGTMGDSGYDKEIRKWINDKTKNFLNEQTDSLRTNADDDMLLLSTIYFSAKWSAEFNAKSNTKDIFHGKDADRLVEFMHQESYSMSYYQSDNYTAVRRHFEEGGSMWLIRPNDGVDVTEVAKDEKLLDPILSATYEDFHNPKVILSLPKFDIACSSELTEPLKALGVKDIFESGKADFTALKGVKDDGFIRSVRHDARVMIDEEGCTAAAFTASKRAGAALPPPEEVEFTLDHPFIFLIAAENGTPLFAGIVQDPS